MKVTRKVTTEVKSEVSKFKFGYWWEPDEDDDKSFVKVGGDPELQAEMAMRLDCSPELIDAVYELFDELTERLCQDLQDLAMENYRLRQGMDAHE